MALQIKANPNTFVKLHAMNLILATAKEKLDLYLIRNYELMQEMIEDEEALTYMNMYYEDEKDELIQCAHDSVFTANEVEAIIEKIGGLVNE
ncbi:hypothetical protein [Bacillus tropicus]|uniref:hypothetical protein n=1 Tax=Bacillus tropicus TaxID=2026188 RepID=UPI0011A09858|nr:hypothetical protein [Bacillus tropicus]